ncbi:hypothetical protein A9G44_03035 [Gilliamella sp. Occ4-3]|nr:hypothetical protein A9G44_03035 [Gilliamella apicola]
MLFNTPAKSIVNVAVTLAAACLLNAYFSQAVVSVVVVVLGGADGLFAGSSAVLVVVVVVASEMQQLVTANQVVVAVVFSVFAVQQVGCCIVLQGFPVSLVAAAFNSAGAIIAVKRDVRMTMQWLRQYLKIFKMNLLKGKLHNN